MRREIIIMPQAAEDLRGQSQYIARQNPEAAHRFLVEANNAIQRACDMPLLGRAYEQSHAQLKDLRIMAISDFNQHLIFYLPGEKQVEIVRVLHAKRDIENIL